LAFEASFEAVREVFALSNRFLSHFFLGDFASSDRVLRWPGTLQGAIAQPAGVSWPPPVNDGVQAERADCGGEHKERQLPLGEP